MRKNELRKIIADGKTVLNAWLAIANPFSAELMAHQGFDAVTIDLQHGPVDFQAAVGMLAAISTTSAVPMVRVRGTSRSSRRNSWTRAPTGSFAR
jgi:4-hydroxy-2-oxoheptanedioate aldolase